MKTYVHIEIQSNDHKNTGLEKRVEGLSEILNKEISQLEIKNTINEIKNTLDGINSRLEEVRNELITWKME